MNMKVMLSAKYIGFTVMVIGICTMTATAIRAMEGSSTSADDSEESSTSRTYTWTRANNIRVEQLFGVKQFLVKDANIGNEGSFDASQFHVQNQQVYYKTGPYANPTIPFLQRMWLAAQHGVAEGVASSHSISVASYFNICYNYLSSILLLQPLILLYRRSSTDIIKALESNPGTLNRLLHQTITYLDPYLDPRIRKQILLMTQQKEIKESIAQLKKRIELNNFTLTQLDPKKDGQLITQIKGINAIFSQLLGHVLVATSPSFQEENSQRLERSDEMARQVQDIDTKVKELYPTQKPLDMFAVIEDSTKSVVEIFEKSLK
jgi:hypothetical protein